MKATFEITTFNRHQKILPTRNNKKKQKKYFWNSVPIPNKTGRCSTATNNMMSTTQSVNLQADASIKEKLICRLCLVESEGDTAASDQFCKQSDKINIKRILNQHFHFLQVLFKNIFQKIRGSLNK